MDLLVSLDVLLGLSLVYLVFSLAVTSLNEMIAAGFSSRARWLRKGIASLFEAKDQKLNLQEADAVLASPFVSYLGSAGDTFRTSYISAWHLMQGVLHTTGRVAEDSFATVGGIRALVLELPPATPLRGVLLDLCARAGNDVQRFAELLDAWFETFETQLSSWYRQKTQFVVAGLALVVALAMNVDTFALVGKLSASPELRAGVAALARSTASSSPDKALLPDDLAEARGALEQAVAEMREAARSLRACDAASACDRARHEADLQRAVDREAAARQALAESRAAFDARAAALAKQLGEAGLALGWQAGELDRVLSGSWAAAFTKLFGLLISACALALGAPFWFNVLRSVASVRSVGANMLERAGRPRR